MKHAILIVLVAVGASVNAQSTTNILDEILASASSQLAIAESSYGTRNPAWESLYSDAASQVSAAISSLGTATANGDEYSSIAEDLTQAFGGPPDYSEITATGSELSSLIGSATSALESVETAIASEISEASSGVSATNPVASYTANVADHVQVGALGAAGAAILGLAAFL